jgi:hypothetical protein
MTPLTVRLEHYLAVRRDFGHDLSTSGRVLRRFAEFAATEGADHVTVELFLRWKAHFGCANNNTWSARLGMVRAFAGWLQAIDPRTEIPPPGLVSGKLRRTRPYIYSAGQIAEIVKGAARLTSAYGLRGWTYSTLFGLTARCLTSAPTWDTPCPRTPIGILKRSPNCCNWPANGLNGL